MSVYPSKEYFKDSGDFQSYIDSIEHGAFLHNKKGKIIGYNSKALDILSLKEERILLDPKLIRNWNASFIDGTRIVYEESPVTITQRTGKHVSNIIINIWPDNQESKWLLVNTKYIQIGEDNHVFTTFTDISNEMKEARSNEIHVALPYQKSDNINYNEVFNCAATGNAILNLNGVFINVNLALCAMLEYQQEEMIGLNIHSVIYPDAQLEFTYLTNKLIKKEINNFDIEIRGLKKDSGECWLHLSGTIFEDKLNNQQFFILQIQETTVCKKMNEVLENEKKELQQKQYILEKKISQLKEFAGIITHDVRGPAHNIKKMLEMYETTEDIEIKETSYEYLKKVSTDLTNNLNELIKILQIHLERDIPLSDCFFEEIVESACLQLQDKITQKNATIRTNFSVSHILYPKVFLQSIVYNLLSNSLKYAIPDIPPQIEISSFIKSGNICLSIKDNGLGIDMNKFGHMLFKFQKSFHSGYESKGIGLYLIKNQIEDQGGSISAESEPYKGTTFTVRF